MTTRTFAVDLTVYVQADSREEAIEQVSAAWPDRELMHISAFPTDRKCSVCGSTDVLGHSACNDRLLADEGGLPNTERSTTKGTI